MQPVWYTLIHVSIGLIGYELFTFDNRGGLYAAVTAALVQAWPAWELHRLAWPRFRASLANAPSLKSADKMKRDYWWRMGRVYMLRICIFSFVTLVVAAAARA